MARRPGAASGRPSGLATSTLYRRCATDTVLGQRLHLVCGQTSPDAAPRTQSSSASIAKSPTECSRTCRGSIRMSTNGSPTMCSEPSCVQCGFLTPMSWRRKAEQLARESISWIATTGVRLDEADLVLDLLCRWVFHRSAGWAVSSWSFRSCVAAQLASRASPSWEALSGSGL